jgi:hypothetical protein
MHHLLYVRAFYVLDWEVLLGASPFMTPISDANACYSLRHIKQPP